MSAISVRIPPSASAAYTILISPHAIGKLADDLSGKPLGTRYAIITDAATKKLFGNALLRQLHSTGIAAELFSFPAGERSKTILNVNALCNQLSARGFGRDAAIIALGGGVVGDVAGFAAAVYLRGIPYVQVPTTLLAMVDSSIGGKTGVDTKHGKNLIGAFKQPAKVYADISLLATLPPAQLRNGLAEVIKTAAIADERFFTYIEQNLNRAIAMDKAVLACIVHQSCVIKKTIVEKDERESGLRMVVNFGHTVGHALEALSHYRIPHGEAVAMGMVVEAELSRRKGLLPAAGVTRLRSILAAAGLPVQIPPYTPQRILAAMKTDKKARKGEVRYVLLRRIGAVAKARSCTFTIPDAVVKEVLALCRKS